MRGAGPPPAASSQPDPPSSSRPSLRPITDADFPEFKPPFLEEYAGRGAIVAPDGGLWVSRVTASGEPFSLVDIFDGKGVRVRQVKLPAGTRVIGFGQSSVYLLRVDDDGLQWVQRHPKP
jgi:hypothetical protein